LEVQGVVSYKRLWKLLIDKDMNKHDLMEVASLSTATVAKMTKGENLNTDILVRVCNALHCTASDILEIYPDETGDKKGDK
jgi:DNA-binding Xre family transcriptional regulator